MLRVSKRPVGVEPFEDGVEDLIGDLTTELGHRRERLLVKLQLVELLERVEDADVRRGDQRVRDTGLSGPPGSSGSVNVDLGALGHVIVDDRRQAADVDTTRSDVGGDEEVDLSGAHAREGFLALVLRELAVDDVDADVLALECVRDGERRHARVREDDRAVASRGSHEAAESFLLLVLTGREVLVSNALSTDLVTADVDRRRFADEVLGDTRDGRSHRCAADERLACFRQLRDDVEDVLLESHREQLVRLVESEVPDVSRVEALAPEEVEQAPRRRDDDVGCLERVELWLERGSAVDSGALQALRFTEALELSADLESELTGRRQDERLDGAVVGGRGLNERENEGGGLTGTRLGLDDDVRAFEECGDALLLDRRRFVVASIGDGFDD